jgi:hypothetical protein
MAADATNRVKDHIGAGLRQKRRRLIRNCVGRRTLSHGLRWRTKNLAGGRSGRSERVDSG